MRSIQMRAKAGADGVLHLSIPSQKADQEYDVIVYLHPYMTDWPPGYFEEVVGSITDETFVRPPQCPHEQQAEFDWPPGFFEQTAGAWQGELERPPQGDYEKREDL